MTARAAISRPTAAPQNEGGADLLDARGRFLGDELIAAYCAGWRAALRRVRDLEGASPTVRALCALLMGAAR